jgi:hypothetical protein
MRANTNTRTRRGPNAWHHSFAVVLALGCLAIPATAQGESLPSPDTYLQQQGSGIDGSSSAGALPTPDTYLGQQGKSIEPVVASGSPTSSDDGFDWASAVIGAGAAMAIVALGSAVFLTVRRRTAVSPSGASLS